MERMQAAQLSALGQVDGMLEVVDAAALCSGLKHAGVTMDALCQRLYFADGHPARLLAIDILARSAASSDASACQWSPVAIKTASMSGRASNSNKSE